MFDLKGSTVERFTKKIQDVDKTTALKDLDFLWMTKVENDLIQFTETDKEKLNKVLNSDLSLLKELNLMDYSLLLIIISFPEPNDSEYNNIIKDIHNEKMVKRIFVSKNSKYIYCLGIIDYLQSFNMSKFLENKYKKLIFREKIKDVSAVDPLMYATRMLNFANQNIFI